MSLWLVLSGFTKSEIDSLKKAMLIERNEARQIELRLKLTEAYIDAGQFDRAYNLGMQQVQLYDSLDNRLPLASIYFLIGHNYRRTGDTEKAKEYFLKCISIAQKNDFTETLGNAYAGLGGAYLQNLTNVDSAFFYTEKSLSIFSADSSLNSSIPSNNMGYLLILNKEYSEALGFLNHALDHSVRHNRYNVQATVANNLAKVYLALGNLSKAKYNNMQSRAICEKHDLPYTMEQTYLLGAKIYEADGDFKRAYEEHQLAFQIHDSIFNNIETVDYINELEKQFEEERNRNLNLKNEQKIKELELAEAKKNRYLVLLVSILLVISVLVVFVVYRFKTRNKLLKQQIEIDAIKQTKLVKETTQKESRIKDYSLLNLENTLFVEELDKKLKDLQKQIGASNENMIALKRLTTNYKSANKSKKFLHEEMDEYNRQFFVKLRESYPSLSKTELNLAVFIRLKLSSKEISAFMNVEPKTINVYKYRMKQKMGVAKGDSLEKFLEERS